MEYVSIQYLRAIAALMVVLYHIEIPLRRLGYTGVWPGWLSSGVDIFFIISGVIMWVTTCNKPVSPITFYMRRAIRIVPLYWTVTSFLVFMMLVFPHHVQSAKFELYHVVTSYLFIASMNPFTGSVQPVIILGWTLNYEMLFYLIFGASLLLPVRKRLYPTLGILAGLVILGMARTPGEPSVFAFYTSDIILEFGLGLIIGKLVAKRAHMPPSVLERPFVRSPCYLLPGSKALWFTLCGLGSAGRVDRGRRAISGTQRETPRIPIDACAGKRILLNLFDTRNHHCSDGPILAQPWFRELCFRKIIHNCYNVDWCSPCRYHGASIRRKTIPLPS